jgi:hypothetical protein
MDLRGHGSTTTVDDADLSAEVSSSSSQLVLPCTAHPLPLVVNTYPRPSLRAAKHTHAMHHSHSSGVELLSAATGMIMAPLRTCNASNRLL